MRQSGGLVATWSKDQRDVYVLSTIHDDTMVDTSDGQQRRTTHETLKPAAVVRYNKNKAGVDRFDQLNAYTRLAEKLSSGGREYFFGCWKSHKSTLTYCIPLLVLQMKRSCRCSTSNKCH